MADEESCSDCKLETIERLWTETLLNWLYNCVSEQVKEINIKSLEEVLNKYKDDVCNDYFDHALLVDSDLDTFFQNKFPILRLSSIEDDSQRFYILMSALLYYCCTNTKGQVSSDICNNLSEVEQILIIKFCEILSTMEVTLYNVKTAIEGAYKHIHEENNKNNLGTDWSDSEMTDSDKMDSIVKFKKSTNPTTIKFKSSITVLPSVVNDTSRSIDYSDDAPSYVYVMNNRDVYMKPADVLEENVEDLKEPSGPPCQDNCACTKCSSSEPCCGYAGGSKETCNDNNKLKWTQLKKIKFYNRKWAYYATFILLLLVLVIFLSTISFWLKINKTREIPTKAERRNERSEEPFYWTWQCKNNQCHKVLSSKFNTSTYNSISECTLLCTGPQLWPLPVGKTHFSKTIVYISTKRMEYKFNSLPSEEVRQYLAEAFKLFIKDLASLERNNPKVKRKSNITVKKMIIQIDIESDFDPKLRLNTDESYILKVKSSNNSILINISSISFCGSRHGLETLSQLLLSDQNTGYLITFSDSLINDSPAYKYRGLMVDSVANFIPTIDVIRTIDAMSYSKLNTFHWRVDMTSFPVEQNVFLYGPCDKLMVYSKEDMEFVVKRAGFRGIRVLIEAAVPSVLGSPWTWYKESSCPNTNVSSTSRISLQDIFSSLQNIYTLIFDLTKVDDVFHLGQNIFPSLLNCYGISDSDYFEKALQHLKLSHKGFLPRLPIIWYNGNFLNNFDTWPRFGVQYNSLGFANLSKYKVIVSVKWDLSCETKVSSHLCVKYRTWQQMYSWISWRSIEAFTIEGGEATLWTDFVDSSNLDYHLWPRAACVAERLWSDVVAGSKPDKFVYTRLDTHRSRMLRRGVHVAPIWPAWCSSNPGLCLQNVQ